MTDHKKRCEEAIDKWDTIKDALPDDGHASAELLFDCGDKLADAAAALFAERDALKAELARLREALTLYSCDDGCNDCPEHERDIVGCGWTARAALGKATP